MTRLDTSFAALIAAQALHSVEESTFPFANRGSGRKSLKSRAQRQLDVDLRCEDGELHLLIRDNGTGFNVESVRAQTVDLGLIGIKERAALVGGRAEIISSPNKGTTIEVCLPVTSRPGYKGGHI